VTIPHEAPILLTLAGVQIARAGSTRTGWLASALLVGAAAVALAVLRPQQAVPVAIGAAVAVLWPLVLRDPGVDSPWRVGKPAVGLLLLGVAIAVQASWLELRWTSIPARTLEIALALLLVEPATRAVRMVLALARSPVTGAGLGAGEMIGVLERLVIFLLILADGYAALGFVIAAKGLARYEKMKDEKQAEYVLLGTLASVLLVLLAGTVVRGHRA